MTDVVERVARALCLESCLGDPGKAFIDANWPCYEGAALAAIRAMREPTNAMAEAFMSRNAKRIEPTDEHWLWEGDFGQFAASYQTMIDTAQNEKEGGE